MIFTRWGGECTIVARFGMQKAPYFEHMMNLVLVRHTDASFKDKPDRFYWGDLLRATDGWPEIETAMKDAPEFFVRDIILQAAFKEAE